MSIQEFSSGGRALVVSPVYGASLEPDGRYVLLYDLSNDGVFESNAVFSAGEFLDAGYFSYDTWVSVENFTQPTDLSGL